MLRFEEMDKKQQILIIGGGTTFQNAEAYKEFLQSYTVNLERLRQRKDWKDSLKNELGSSYDVLQAKMPNATNAQYDEWKIVLDKILMVVDENIILIGHSLGALFLAKYFSENSVSKKVKSLFLVAAPFDDESKESLGSFILDADKIKAIEKRVPNIFMYYSADDPVVTFSEANKYMQRLPNAILRSLDGRSHFNQEGFPEIIKDLQSTL